MITLQKLSRDEIIGFTGSDYHRSLQDTEKSTMAIPSYLHPNPLVRWLMWKRYEIIAGWLDLEPDSRVFEFGCGTGIFLPTLCSRGSTVFALDLAPSIAKKLSQNNNLQTQFVDDIHQIEDESLDAVIAADVLEHIEDSGGIVNLLNQKLKHGGSFFVSGPTENRVYQILRDLVGFEGKGDYHVSNIDLLIPLIKKSGFSGRRQKSLPFKFGPAIFRLIQFIKTS